MKLTCWLQAVNPNVTANKTWGVVQQKAGGMAYGNQLPAAIAAALDTDVCTDCTIALHILDHERCVAGTMVSKMKGPDMVAK